MSAQPGPWVVYSHLGPRMGAYWYVRRDVFAGVEYLKARDGARRSFPNKARAQRAADEANAKATGSKA